MGSISRASSFLASLIGTLGLASFGLRSLRVAQIVAPLRRISRALLRLVGRWIGRISPARMILARRLGLLFLLALRVDRAAPLILRVAPTSARSTTSAAHR